MKTGLMILLLGLISMMMALPASAAEWDEKSVGKVKKLLLEGKGFSEFGAYPKTKRQVLNFSVPGLGRYHLEFNNNLCFLEFAGSGAILRIPCQTIKKGYPILAPLITWEKDGHAQ